MARAMKYSGIEWIGEIPAEWSITRLKNAFSFGKGLPITKENLIEVGIPVISYGQIHAKYNSGVAIHNDLLRYVSPTYLETNPESLVQKGDIILADTSEDLDGCGNAVYVNQESQLFAGYHTIILKSPEHADNKYIAYLMRTDPWRSQLRSKVYGIKVFSISRKILSDVTLIRPPSSEQRRISDFLDRRCTEIDSVIADTHKTIEEYKALKQSIITEAVTHGVRGERPMKDSGVEWIGEIPEDWISIRFKFLAQVKSNLVSPDNYGDYPQVSPENIEKGTGRLFSCKTVSEVGVISGNHLFYRGQILYSKIRPKLNKLTIAPFDGLCSADMYPIETTQDTRFLLYAMLSGILLSQVAMITEDRVKMPKINQDELGNTWFTKPPIEEQREIADYLDKKCADIDQLIGTKQQLLTELETYKKSVIYEYVTGKKEVPS